MGQYATLDDALASLRDAGPELRNGLTNHAPMAVEALCAMGRGDAVPAWVERYRGGLLPMPQRVEPIDATSWQAALAHEERFADWYELIAGELRDSAWQAVLERWVPRLGPGISAAATHGVIRVGHAVRALDNEVTPTRIDELARGIAYWAATYQSLPTELTAQKASEPRQAIKSVALVPAERRRFAGTITSALTALDEDPEFRTVIGRALLDGNPDAVISQLTRTFAGIYLANAHDVLTTIVFIHSVTSAAAVRSIVVHLSDVSTRMLLPYLWQAQCALYAAFGSRVPADSVISPSESRDDLIERAVANGDEHVIKFTEACIREDAITPAPVYRAAASHAIKMMSA